MKWRGLAAALLLIVAGRATAQQTNAPAAEAASPALDLYGMAPGEYRNWVTFTTGINMVDGDKGSFMQRNGVHHGAYGGIEDFHWEQDVGKGGLFRIDGRGIFDDHDYSVKLELSQPDKGFLRAGITQSRTWSESGGGYYPAPSVWLSPSSPYYSLDRGSVWFEAGLRKPDVPEVTLRYEHQYRRGQKSSTEWGDITLTGPGTRGIVPAFYDIDEWRDIVSLDSKHSLGNTDLGLALRFEKDHQMDSRNTQRSPNSPTASRYLTERDGFTSDMFNMHAWSETQFTDELLLTTGYSFTTLDSDIVGSRIYGPGYDPVYDPLFANRQTRDEGFINLSGGSQLDQHVMMLNLQWSPFDAFTVTPSLRVEREDIDNADVFTETNFGNAPAVAATQEDTMAQSRRGTIDVAECLDIRYSGITNWVFYAQLSWMEGQGSLTEQEMSLATGIIGVSRNTDFRRYTSKYEVGANWYPLKRLHFAVQYYHKTRTEDYGNLVDSTANLAPSSDRYPAFILKQGFDTDDVNFRVTFRPWNNVTLVSRYDFQLSKISMTADGLGETQSGRNTMHVLSQSISWAPTRRIYVQASGNYYYDHSQTPAAANAPGSTLVPSPRNDYWSANCIVGCAVSPKTDLQAQYSFYKANDYINNAASSQPYGASSEEQGVTASITERLRKDLRLTLKYGFFRNRDVTSGGFYNYDAHVVSSSLQYFF